MTTKTLTMKSFDELKQHPALHDPNQKTGRTFRQILQAIIFASEGKRVMFVCGYADRLSVNARTARNILQSTGTQSVVEFHKTSTTFECRFPNGGVLIFSQGARMGDIGDTEIVKDHV